MFLIINQTLNIFGTECISLTHIRKCLNATSHCVKNDKPLFSLSVPVPPNSRRRNARLQRHATLALQSHRPLLPTLLQLLKLVVKQTASISTSKSEA